MKNLPYMAICNNDKNVTKIPKLDTTPKGYEAINKYMVDNSGFGREKEMALTFEQFLDKVKKDFYYAITDEGQWQVCITEYKRV